MPVVITIQQGIGEAGKSIVYVRRHSVRIDGPVKDRYDRVIAISSRCVHVGCPVRYVPAAQSFVWPCHGGVYDFRGIRVGGPPPATRSLRYAHPGRPGIGGSALQRQQRASALRPGRSRPALDGIGQLLYPARFSTAPAPPGAKP
jgi:menaquinol-cytochrome c reductase iron-sulfur subunit